MTFLLLIYLIMNITVIGELSEDKFFYGEVKRICPEAPIPVLHPVETVSSPGMAGNVVRNLQVLDNTLNINVIHQKSNITKTRYVDFKSNHMFLRIDEGENNLDKFKLTDKISKTIKESDAVIISDYNKNFLSNKDIVNIGSSAKLSILDTKRILTQKIIDSVTFIKVNEYEYSKNSKLLSKNLRKVIKTVGAKGAVFDSINYPSPKVRYTIDVSGAGDTFTASFMYKYLQCRDIEKAIVYANSISADVVTKRGVSIPETQ